ncbi:hypothetical protein R5R35_002607 [Gryllus longicercus]|uniref:Uncharacterized protein n=1 Tax=Gryllus longicercus TaxID=2509291 RepID=A0AAN9VBV8_9ORTH
MKVPLPLSTRRCRNTVNSAIIFQLSQDYLGCIFLRAWREKKIVKRRQSHGSYSRSKLLAGSADRGGSRDKRRELNVNVAAYWISISQRRQRGAFGGDSVGSGAFPGSGLRSGKARDRQSSVSGSNLAHSPGLRARSGG